MQFNFLNKITFNQTFTSPFFPKQYSINQSFIYIDFSGAITEKQGNKDHTENKIIYNSDILSLNTHRHSSVHNAQHLLVL